MVKGFTRELSGAVVTFTSGAVVSNIELSAASYGKSEMETIIIMWPKPSHTVTLLFDTQQAARNALEEIRTPDLSELCHGGFSEVEHIELPGPRFYALYCKNLKLNTTPNMVASCLPTWSQPSQVFLRPHPLRNFDESIRRDLCTFGAVRVELADATSSPLHDRYIAVFSCAVGARKAMKALDDMRELRLSGIDFEATNPIYITFTVPIGIFRVVEPKLRILVMLRQDGHVYADFQSTETIDPASGLATFEVVGEGPEAMARLKRDIEQVLVGMIAKRVNTPIWTDFFLTPEGLEWLRKLGRLNACYVHRDKKRRRLALYALHGAGDNRAHCIASLALRARISKTKSEADKKAVQRQESDILKRSRADCSVCLSEASEPYLTSCGHVYCKACLTNQCSHTTDNFPIRCLGLAGACDAPLNLEDLQSAIPTTAFEILLRMSLESYIRRESTTLHYCPTPDCNHLYRLPTNNQPFTCPSCFCSACLSCHYPDHDGQTCQQYQITLVGTAFQEWKTDNGVRDCPKCATPIQKEDGCNHIHCLACSTHFCWRCMLVFDGSGSTYRHMTEVHGGWDGEGGNGVQRVPERLVDEQGGPVVVQIEPAFMARLQDENPAPEAAVPGLRAPVALMHGMAADERMLDAEAVRRVRGLTAYHRPIFQDQWGGAYGPWGLGDPARWI